MDFYGLSTMPWPTPFVVFANEFSGACDRHMFRSLPSVWLDILLRTFQIPFTTMKREVHNHLRELAKPLLESKTAMTSPDALLSALPATPLLKALPVAQHAEIKREVQRIAFMHNGECLEKNEVKRYHVQENNQQLYRKLISDDPCIMLMGRVDGWITMPDGTSRLMELKHRQRPNVSDRPIPAYDRIQCWCYLHLTGERSMLLRERGLDPLGPSRETDIRCEESEWKALIKSVRMFVGRLRTAWASPEWHSNFALALLDASETGKESPLLAFLSSTLSAPHNVAVGAPSTVGTTAIVAGATATATAFVPIAGLAGESGSATVPTAVGPTTAVPIEVATVPKLGSNSTTS
jgi:hypothetical protein